MQQNKIGVAASHRISNILKMITATSQIDSSNNLKITFETSIVTENSHCNISNQLKLLLQRHRIPIISKIYVNKVHHNITH